MANVQLPQIGINNTQIDEAGMDGLKQHVKSLLNVTVMLTEELTYLLNNLDTRNVNELNADIINAGTINANLVKIMSELSNGGYISFDGEGMKVNDGTQDTMTIGLDGKPRMSGAYIESAQGFPKVVMDPDSELLGAYKLADNYIQIYSPVERLSPVVRFFAGSVNSYIFYDPSDNTFTMTSNTADINLSTQGDIQLFAPNVYVSNWGFLKNYSTGRSLQQELNNKATSGSSTGSSGSANGGIPIGATWETSVGTVTWMGVPAHSHTQN